MNFPREPQGGFNSYGAPEQFPGALFLGLGQGEERTFSPVFPPCHTDTIEVLIIHNFIVWRKLKSRNEFRIGRWFRYLC